MIESNTDIELIEEMFNDNRSLTYIDEVNDGRIYSTLDNEIVVLKVFIDDRFKGEDLAELTGLAESLWEKYGLKVNLYVMLMPYTSVDVVECNIKSEADFTIKLAVGNENITDIRNRCDLVLEILTRKINNDTITKSDVEVLNMIPMKCSKTDRLHYRSIVFDLLTRIDNECSIEIN